MAQALTVQEIESHVTHPSSPLVLLVNGGLMEVREGILRLTRKNRERCGAPRFMSPVS